MNLLSRSSNTVIPCSDPVLSQASKFGRPKGSFFLFLFVLVCRGSFAQSVTLSWDAVTSVPVAGYNLYQGTSSGAYNRVIDAGRVTQATVSGLSNGVTYYFAVTAYNNAGRESDFSAEVSYTPSGSSRIVFAADSAILTLPFTASNGIVWQPLPTTLLASGRAAYNFTVAKTAGYVVSALVNAPTTSQNSFYVNIDAEPTDPQNIWEIPVTTGFMSRSVTWGTESAPHVFSLAAGNHQLIIRGREPNTQLSTITISPVGPQLTLTSMAGGLMLLNGLGPIGHSYYVQATTDFIHWLTIGTIVPDDGGAFSFIDSNAGSFRARFYRLRDRTISPALVQLRITRLPGGSVQLTGLGIAGLNYEIQATSDFKTWTVLGNLSADDSGNISFTDKQAPSFTQRYYRLRETTPVIVNLPTDPVLPEN